MINKKDVVNYSKLTIILISCLFTDLVAEIDNSFLFLLLLSFVGGLLYKCLIELFISNSMLFKLLYMYNNISFSITHLKKFNCPAVVTISLLFESINTIRSLLQNDQNIF